MVQGWARGNSHKCGHNNIACICDSIANSSSKGILTFPTFDYKIYTQLLSITCHFYKNSVILHCICPPSMHIFRREGIHCHQSHVSCGFMQSPVFSYMDCICVQVSTCSILHVHSTPSITEFISLAIWSLISLER
ncbi:hypothetical protein BsWGS_00437 [Bradybaena similaris]